ncbi:MAG: hypothetical protein C0500_00695 [Sphingobium sp.]|nr:hypothetical protein [Sphingobium sp.]
MAATVTEQMIAFIEGVGITVTAGVVPDDSFLPGLIVRHGGIVYDPDRLAYPGDLLHEAGHIAVSDPATRPDLSVVSTDPGEEMAAIAWSYAAARAIGLDPAVVFHPNGYRGSAAAIVENFDAGRYIGVPMLEWFGMAADKDEASLTGEPRYPAMRRWLR